MRVPGIGTTDSTGTAQRWFALGPLQITPSEFTKLAIIVTLAAVLANIRTPEPTLRDLFKVLVLAAVPLVLVFLGPDIGTSIGIAAIVVGMLIVAGTKLRHLLVLSVVGIIAIVLVFQTGAIESFQRERLTAFLDPQAVSADVRYNLDQSLIAVGSGGLLGKGYLHGVQTNLDYVPEQHTDFIFTVAGEEFGFVGALARARVVRAPAVAIDPDRLACERSVRDLRRRGDRIDVRDPDVRERRDGDRDHAHHRDPPCRSCPTGERRSS